MYVCMYIRNFATKSVTPKKRGEIINLQNCSFVNFDKTLFLFL